MQAIITVLTNGQSELWSRSSLVITKRVRKKYNINENNYNFCYSCSLTERSTDQVRYILDAQWYVCGIIIKNSHLSKLTT